MHILKARVGLLIAAGLAGLLTLTSCGPTLSTTSAAQHVPAAQRVVLNGDVTPAQRGQIRAVAAARFGGFPASTGGAGMGMVNRSGIIAVNGQHEPFGGGSGGFQLYNVPKGASLTCEPGHLKLVVRPYYSQEPGTFDDAVEFNAKPGHRYFIGHVLDMVGPNVRSVPAVYDQTRQAAVPLSGIKTRTSRLPDYVRGGPPMLIPL